MLVEKLSVDTTVDDDAAGRFELFVQFPDQLVGVGIGNAELCGDFVDPHKNLFCYKKHLLSLGFVPFSLDPVS